MSISDKTCIIIGASHAGAGAAISLRQNGWLGKILLFGEEDVLPYHRPPLSKDLLKGNKDISEIYLRPQSSYEQANIELKTGNKITSIDRQNKTLNCCDGKQYDYDKLIIASGARVRKFPNLPDEQSGVYYLRTATDVKRIQKAAKKSKSALIIGGGYIGLETAASLKSLGLEVTILERESRILQRVTAEIISKFYKRVFLEEKINIIESCSVTGISKDLSVNTNKGDFSGDLIIIGIGVIPNQELAANAGIECENGILVNEYCQTNDKDIYAIGDVAQFHSPLYHKSMRLESVPNATEMAKIAANHICGGDKSYTTLPWFWSDAFDIKLQIAGLSDGYDNIIIRGQADHGRSFACFYFRQDILLAVDAINRPQEFMLAKKLIPLSLGTNKKYDKKALANEDVKLTTFLKPY